MVPVRRSTDPPRKEAVMGCFHVIWTLVVGLVAGLIARVIVGGTQMGLIATTVLGVIGSFVGGFIATLIWRPSNEKFHPAGFLLSIVGAVIALWLWHKFGHNLGPRFAH
jgi:uncharacterized membrane protein YeaQ/YmgE (transglycosylase-associated protein family)